MSQSEHIAETFRQQTSIPNFFRYAGTGTDDNIVTFGFPARKIVVNDAEKSPVGWRYRRHPVLGADACYHRNLLRKFQLYFDIVAQNPLKEPTCSIRSLSNRMLVPYLKSIGYL